MRALISELTQAGVIVLIRRGEIAIISPKLSCASAIRTLRYNRKLALEVLRETQCDGCGGKLDDHEIGGLAICFHCWLQGS